MLTDKINTPRPWVVLIVADQLSSGHMYRPPVSAPCYKAHMDPPHRSASEWVSRQPFTILHPAHQFSLTTQKTGGCLEFHGGRWSRHGVRVRLGRVICADFLAVISMGAGAEMLRRCLSATGVSGRVNQLRLSEREYFSIWCDALSKNANSAGTEYEKTMKNLCVELVEKEDKLGVHTWGEFSCGRFTFNSRKYRDISLGL